MTNATDAARGTTILFVQSIFSGLLRIANIMVLTRLLLQVEMGLVAVLAIIYGFMQFLGAVGLNHAAPLFVPEAEAAGRLGRVKGFLKRSVGIITISSLALVLAVLLVSEVIVGTGVLTRDLLLLVLVIAPFSALEVFLDSFLLARYTVKKLALGRLVYDSARVIATIALVILGVGVAGVVIGWFLGELIAVVVFGSFAVRGLKVESSPIQLGPVLGFALPSLLFQTVDVTIQNTDRILLLHLTDLQTLAVYDVMLSALFMMSFASLGISTALYPVLTRLRMAHESANGQKSDFSGPVSMLLRYIMVILFPISIIGSLNSHSILLLLFGSAYADYPNASLSFALLILFYSLWGVTYALHSVLRSLGEARFFATVGFIIIIFEVIGCWYLTIWIGLLGTALVRCSYIAILLATALWKLRQHGVHGLSPLKSSVLRIVLAAVLPGLLIFILAPPGLLQLVLWLVIALLFYGVMLFALREVNRLDFELGRKLIPVSLQGVLEKVEEIYLGSKQSSL